MPLCGPILFADSETNEVVANQADAEGKLRPSHGVWVGTLPSERGIANTAIEWAGVRWTMVAWPVPEETRDLEKLLAHECYHRIQPALHLDGSDPVSEHLDGSVGRTWLFVEWRALERALMESGAARRSAIGDALRFRACRRSSLPNAADKENRLEVSEGLAEYTGVRIANPDGARQRAGAVSLLRTGASRQSLGRSFAYVSGPAYGLLLDESKLAWKAQLTPFSDLGQLLARAYQITTPAVELTEEACVNAARPYGGDGIIRAEAVRSKKIEEERDAMRQRYVVQPVLVLPAGSHIEYGYNPNHLVSLDEHSTVYGGLRVSDEWGLLEASGAMMVREGDVVKRVVVPGVKKTEDTQLSGDGWRLELKPGWSVVAGPRPGDAQITKSGTKSGSRSGTRSSP
jgi:hypothetical protein